MLTTLNALDAPNIVIAPTQHRTSASPFTPVLADILESDRIFAETLANYRSPVAPMIHHLRHYRGKRLRPALVFLCAKACGGVVPAHHVLAAAVEMIHTATLVHDDVLDEADTRRHNSTFNAEWGNKVSILFGDMLFTHAFHLTSTIDGRACQLIGAATNQVCAGELLQTRERGNWHLTEAQYYEMVDGKTAALTEVATRLGALYAGATPEVAENLATYGRSLGIAFQIADDLLDLTGEEAKAGKTLGTDLEQQKMTLPLIHALNTLPTEEAAEFRKLLQNPAANKRAEVTDTLISSGSLQYAKRRAEEHARTARNCLDCLPRSESRTILEQLTEWSIRREK
jgi:octaprenyl-diphosphate synthase